MFHSAVAPVDEYSNITIYIPGLPSTPVDVYYNIYFTEMTNLTTEMNGAKRSFFSYVDGELGYTNEIVPNYGSDFQLYGNEMASNNTKYEFQRADDSTLPPIISGLEFFRIFDVNQFTFEDDVQALSALQKHFKVLQEWTGDPCLPENYNWEWIGCAYFTYPRINQLNLSGYELSGSLPDFSALNFLVTIDLSNNNFTGDVPEFLAKLPQLIYLNLADNKSTTLEAYQSHYGKILQSSSRNPKLKDELSPPPSPTNGDITVVVPKINLINIIVLFAIVMVYYVYP